jgi:hypothetical protein
MWEPATCARSWPLTIARATTPDPTTARATMPDPATATMDVGAEWDVGKHKVGRLYRMPLYGYRVLDVGFDGQN